MSDTLAGVHPKLADASERIHAAMRELGWSMLITDGVRTVEQQFKLFSQGRTLPGRIVTNADGELKRSNHQPHADGYGHAIDCCFVVDGKPSWDDALPWRCYGEMAKALGLVWGGDWHTPDRPHIEMPPR